MEREARLGRVLWLALVVMLSGYLVVDFTHPTIFTQRGAAAVLPSQITFWIPPGDAEGDAREIVQSAAGGLELQGHPTAVKVLHGGTSAAVAAFLARRANGRDLLVLTSNTLAGIAHDRHDRLVPEAAEQAYLASALVRHVAPLGILASERLSLAVPADSEIRSSSDLASSLRLDSAHHLVAIGEDGWSRVELAKLVAEAGVEDSVRFSAFQSTAEAGSALASGGATAMLATHGAVLDEVRKGGVRAVGWPHRRAPRFWVALVAAPGIPAARLTALRGWTARLQDGGGWRRRMKADGIAPGTAGAHGLRGLLSRALRSAGRLELLSQRVERG